MLKPVIATVLIGWALTFAQSAELVIVYTNNTNGVLENCRCPERSYGALEKRAALIDSIRRVYGNILLLDCGDILDIRQNRLLHDYIVRAYGCMRYDAWTPGDQDFIEGAGFFRDHLLCMPGKLISANLQIGGERTGSPWWQKELAGMKIGISGIMDPRTISYLPDSTADKLSIADPEVSLENIISELDTRCDLIILLSHAGFEKDREIARHFPEIDIIVGGHSQTILENPEVVGKTMIVQAGEGGNRVGILKLKFAKGKISSYANALHLLKKSDKDDPAVLRLISEYHKERNKTMKLYQNQEREL